MNPELVIASASEESRYHRQFHHLIFTTFFALYLTLAGFQLSEPCAVTNVMNRPELYLPVGLCLYFLLPAVIIYIIGSYHKSICRLNRVIAFYTQKPITENEIKEAQSELFFHKYLDKHRKGTCYLFIGRGHWLFIGTIVVLVILNLYISIVT